MGGDTWDVDELGTRSMSNPPQDPIVGAVAPDGRAVAVWFRANTNNSLASKFEYSTKPAGSSSWAARQDLQGFMGNAPGIPSLAINSAGQAAFAFTRQFNRIALGATMNAAGTWTSLTPLNISTSNSPGLGDAVVAIDEAGIATAAWSRNNAPPAGSGDDIVQFSTTTAGTDFPTAPASGPNDLSSTGGNSQFPAIAVAPAGSTTVAWVRGNVLEERTRPAGGGAFGGVTTIPNTLTIPGGPLLAAGGDGSMTALWAGTASKPVIGGARRAPGAGAFAAVPGVPGEDNTVPALAADDQGNAAGAWLHTDTTGPTYTVQATGLDAAGPAIMDVSFPAAAGVGASFPYGATLFDRWAPSSASGLWAFGDGTVGALNGTKAYAADGTYAATLTATDSFSNTSTATRQIVVGTGGGSGGSDVIDPVLTARLTNATFAVNLRGAAETPVASRAKKGTTFVYTLTEPARVVFTIHAKQNGRRVGGKCRKPTKRNTGRRKCTRFVRRGAFAHNGATGANRKKFSGKIGRKRLRPGRYRASLLARDAAGNASTVKRLNFRVVRR